MTLHTVKALMNLSSCRNLSPGRFEESKGGLEAFEVVERDDWESHMSQRHGMTSADTYVEPYCGGDEL